MTLRAILNKVRDQYKKDLGENLMASLKMSALYLFNQKEIDSKDYECFIKYFDTNYKANQCWTITAHQNNQMDWINEHVKINYK